MIPEPTISFSSIILLLGGFSGLLLGWLLLYLRRKNFSANTFLAIILASRGLTLIHQFLFETQLLYQTPSLIGYVLLTEVLLPPALYLYVRNMTQPFGLKLKTIVYFYPSILIVILLIPFFYMDFEVKKTIVESNFINWPNGIPQTTFSLALIVWAAQFIFYLILSFKLLLLHIRSIRHFFSYHENISLIWIRNFLLLNLISGLFIAYFYMSFAQSEENIIPVMRWFLYFSVLLVFYLGLKGLTQRRIYKARSDFKTMGHVTASKNSNQTKNNKDSKLNEKKISYKPQSSSKYKNSALTDDLSQNILTRLTNVMQNDKPYLNNDLTLPELSKIVSTSPNYLSQVINERLHMNFFDYVNSYRIETAKILIINPQPVPLTIYDIAMESAFNSKSAFYSAFKKQVGMTPSIFKKNHLKKT